MDKHKFIRSTLLLTISEIIFNISGYLIHMGVGRILGPAEYGRYSVIITLTTMIIILIGSGIPTAMGKYLSEFFETDAGMIRAIKKQGARLQIILVGIVTVLFFFSSPIIAKAFNDPTLTPLFQLSSLIIPSFAAASFYFYFYTGIHRFDIQASLKIIRSIMRVIMIVGLAYFFRVEGSILGYFFAPLLTFICAFLIDKFWIEKQFPIDESKTFDWKKLLNYAWPITLFMIFYEVLISIDLYFVKSLLQSDFLTGIYNGSLTLARIPYYLFYALTIILLPAISKNTANNNHEVAKNLIEKSLRLMIMLILPTVLLMKSYAPQIIDIFYGKHYEASAEPMGVLVIGIGFLTIFYVMSFAFNGAGFIKTPMLMAFLGMIINSILNYFLILRMGIIGSAYATSITSILMAIWTIYFSKSHFKTMPSLTFISKVFISSFLIYALSRLLPSGKITFIFYFAILMVVYFSLLYMFKEIKNEDINLIKNALTKRKKLTQ